VWTSHDAAVAAGCRVDAQRCRMLSDDRMLTVGDVSAGQSHDAGCGLRPRTAGAVTDEELLDDCRAAGDVSPDGMPSPKRTTGRIRLFQCS